MISPISKGGVKTIELKTSEDILSVVLANLYIIGIKAKNYHWNTEGPKFYGDHKTFDEIYEGAYGHIDTIGERMRALRYHVRSDLPFIMKTATVGDDFETDPDEMCCDLTEILEEFSANLQEGFIFVDRTTENILQEIDAWAGKMAYFTRSVMPDDDDNGSS